MLAYVQLGSVLVVQCSLVPLHAMVQLLLTSGAHHTCLESRLGGQTFPLAMFESQTLSAVILCDVAEENTASGQHWTLTRQLLSSLL